MDSGVSAPKTRRALLREATAASHRSVEQLVDAAEVWTRRDRYRDYLERMQTFHRQFVVAPPPASLQAAPFWRIDARLAALRSDLAALGAPTEHAEACPVGMAAVLPDATASLGALYVLIGSSLGARVLVARARALFAGDPIAEAYLVDLTRHDDWKGFLTMLESAVITTEDALAAGACSMFESVRAHLSMAT